MDGVLIDSGPLHLAAWQELFRGLGRSYTRQEFLSTFGLRNDAILRQQLGFLPAAEAERLILKKEAMFRARLLRDGVMGLPGAVELVRHLHRHGTKQAVVSSGPRDNVELVLVGLGVAPLLQVVLAGEDVERGKPDPQGYLLAAQRLGVGPGECAVIEDAPGGVAAGRAAGMRVIGLTSSHPPEALAGADLVVASLEDPQVLSFLVGRTRPAVQ